MESQERVLRKPEVFHLVALSDSTIWRMEKSGLFPKRLKIGGNSVGWLKSEIDEWIETRAEQRAQ